MHPLQSQRHDMQEKKKRLILIGKSSAGKTTLCQRIANEDLKYHKTQTVQTFNENMIDTPGEYLERRAYRGALMVTSYDADVIIFVQDATEGGTMFPPSYAATFTKPVVGVVSKCDLVSGNEIDIAEKYLQMAGATEIFCISSVTGEGVEALMKHLGYA